MKIRAFFHYYGKVLVYNIEFTCTMLFLLAGSSLLSAPELTLEDMDPLRHPGNDTLSWSLATAFSFMAFRIFRGFEYPLYFNLGFLPLRLKTYTASLNVLVILVSAALYYGVSRWLA